MKVLLVNGSARANGCTHAALTEVASALGEEGIEAEQIFTAISRCPGLASAAANAGRPVCACSTTASTAL